jgi:hypothetical protein
MIYKKSGVSPVMTFPHVPCLGAVPGDRVAADRGGPGALGEGDADVDVVASCSTEYQRRRSQ